MNTKLLSLVLLLLLSSFTTASFRCPQSAVIPPQFQGTATNSILPPLLVIYLVTNADGVYLDQRLLGGVYVASCATSSRPSTDGLNNLLLTLNTGGRNNSASPVGDTPCAYLGNNPAYVFSGGSQTADCPTYAASSPGGVFVQQTNPVLPSCPLPTAGRVPSELLGGGSAVASTEPEVVSTAFIDDDSMAVGIPFQGFQVICISNWIRLDSTNFQLFFGPAEQQNCFLIQRTSATIMTVASWQSPGCPTTLSGPGITTITVTVNAPPTPTPTATTSTAPITSPTSSPAVDASPTSSPGTVSSPTSSSSPSVGSASNQNPNAATSAGISPGVSALIAILVIGAVAGIAGFLYYRRTKSNITTMPFSTSQSTLKNIP
jgi:hypothetical protein